MFPFASLHEERNATFDGTFCNCTMLAVERLVRPERALQPDEQLRMDPDGVGPDLHPLPEVRDRLGIIEQHHRSVHRHLHPASRR